MRITAVTITALTLTCTSLLADPLTFDFKDPKGVNNATFKLDAPLEAISGSANGISGKVTFDPKNVEATRGKIVVATKTMHVPNPMMKEHMLGEQWMNAAEFPEITFEAKSVKNAKASGKDVLAEVTGALTVRGVTRTVTVPVKFTYLPDKLSLRVPNQQGDLLVMRATFTMKRGDFGINPGAPQEKVADEVELTLSIAGASPR